MEKINQMRIRWVMVVLVMIVIFSFSAQPALESARLSGGITKVIVSSVVSNFDYFTEDEQALITKKATFMIRKSAHATIYFILGMTTMLAIAKTAQITGYKKIQKKQSQIFLALMIGLLYALSDEFHQRFVLGRSGELRDVLIDVAGASLGIFVVWLITTIGSNIGSRRRGL